MGAACGHQANRIWNSIGSDALQFGQREHFQPQMKPTSAQRSAHLPSLAMLSAEKNERLTRVGPGTPMGELLRRYWWPIATHDISRGLLSQAAYVVIFGSLAWARFGSKDITS